MSTKIIPHIFGSLLSLEKSLAIVTEKKLKLPSDDLPKILSEMKKLAQLIQLQFARKDTDNAMRSLKLFYGLLTMIRPLITDALNQGAGRPVKQRASNFH